jgi:pimeloyl-ACP methyl ester carboxylesterase
MTSHRTELRSPAAPAAPRDATPAELTLARPANEASAVEAPTIAETLKLAARTAGVITIAVVLIALVVRAGFTASARRWLAFPFTGVPASPGEVASIFIHNLRALAAIFGLLLVAQSGYWAAPDAQPAVVHRTVRRLGEALLGAAVAANVIVVGASLGAYGTRMVRAALPHGPVELAAYSLALALYLQGRSRPLPIRHVLAVAALSISVLAFAALLETFVNV